MNKVGLEGGDTLEREREECGNGRGWSIHVRIIAFVGPIDLRTKFSVISKQK